MNKVGNVDVMSSKEASDYTGIPETQLNAWRHRNKNSASDQFIGPRYIQVGGKVLYLKDSVRNYLKALGVSDE